MSGKKIEKKAPVKKLKSKKLEERIAPGMIGSGVVDPGIADTSLEPDSDSGSGSSSMETDLESSSIESSTEQSGGQYLEDTKPSFEDPGFQEPNATEPVPMDASYEPPSSFDSADLAPSGDYVVEHDSWKEPDWVTANADGSVTVQPPAGVSIDNGIANFPMEVANEELPLPEEITLQADGSVDIALPEGASFNAETNQLTLPAGDAQPQDVPQDFAPVVNPDGSMTLTFPEGQVEYDAEANTLNLSNGLVNEIAPSYMEVNLDGSVSIDLPEGTAVNADGTWTVPAEATHYMDNPPPEYVQDVEFAEYQADGSVGFELPEGAVVQDGIAEFPYEVAVEHLPIPDDIQLNADGTINIGLPEGATYSSELNALTMPGDHFSPSDVPEGINCFPNADGSWTVPLPDGMNYDASTDTVHMSNYWANEFAPDPVYIGTDGSIAVELPPETQFHADGSFTIPPEQAGFMDTPAPNYVHDAPYSEPLGDGSYAVQPPEGVLVQETPYGTQMQFSYEAVAENVPLPHEAEILPDGGMKVWVPEGTQYDADAGRLTLPEGSVNLSEFPEGINAHVNPDGTIAVTLPEGISYDAANGSVTMNNFWSNEFAPPSVEITYEGGVNVTLPPTVDHQPDGSFVIPAESADFLQNPDPAYTIGGPEWVTPNPDGSVMFTPPADIAIQPTEGTMTMNFEQVEENFGNQLPEGTVIHPDGSIDMIAPQGTQYDPNAGVLTLPAGEINPTEIPSGIAYEVLEGGSVAITLPPGIEFDPATQTVSFDNHWANEVAPENVTIQPNGYVEVALPPQTQYFDNGGFSVPPAHADFIDNPAPGYCYEGPAWVNMSPDGAVHLTPPVGVNIDPDAGTMSMKVDVMNEQFENHIPSDMQFNADGTVNIAMPSYVSFDPATGVLTFPAEHAAEHMPPPQVMPYFNAAGDLCINLPPGIEFDAATNSVHLDNHWTNELAPPNVEIQPNGYVNVQMPQGTHYHDGGCTLPPDQANFMDEPQPHYVSDGPEFVQHNPDGSFAVQPPPTMTVDPAAGTVTMSMDTFTTELHMNDGDMKFNADGTADVKLPEGTQYDAANGTLNFPAGSTQLHEIPPQVNPVMNADGSISVKLPEGISYDAQTGSVHLNNQWLNELVPQPVTFNTDGTVVIDLPDDTQYFEGGSFVISAENSNFMDDGHHGEGSQPPPPGEYPPPQYSGQYPYPEYQQQYAPPMPVGTTTAA